MKLIRLLPTSCVLSFLLKVAALFCITGVFNLAAAAQDCTNSYSLVLDKQVRICLAIDKERVGFGEFIRLEVLSESQCGPSRFCPISGDSIFFRTATGSTAKFTADRNGRVVTFLSPNSSAPLLRHGDNYIQAVGFFSLVQLAPVTVTDQQTVVGMAINKTTVKVGESLGFTFHTNAFGSPGRNDFIITPPIGWADTVGYQHRNRVF